MDEKQRDRLGRALRRLVEKAQKALGVCGGESDAQAVQKQRAAIVAMVEEFVGAAARPAKGRKAK